MFVLAVAWTAWLSACGSEDEKSSEAAGDAGIGSDAADAAEVEASVQEDSATDTAPEVAMDAPADAAEDAAEAGPTSCAEPCGAACDAHTAVEGDCASCVQDVCATYESRAEGAPNRDAFFTCMDACGSDANCPNQCCNQYPQACAWEVAFEMCTCGFPEDSCAADCMPDCTEGGLTEACGVCASQSPCSQVTFDYLFAPNRSAHQDCVTTCASSSMSLDECLGLCREDYAWAGAAYDAYLACVCAMKGS